MSSHIIASLQPAKERLVSLLKEVNQLEIKSPDPSMTIEEKEDFYVIRKRVLEDKLRRIQLCVTTLESINDKWFTYTQQIVTMKRREEEEEKYKTVTEGVENKQTKKEAKFTPSSNINVITLTMHKDEVDQNLKQLSKELRTNKQKKKQNLLLPPHLSLPTFDGDPRQWRQFWSSLNAAVHTQAIPEIQKLNYLYSCLKGKALQAISGYDIAPENYVVIRKLLNEKYGDHSIITTLLYNELQSIKRNEREWIGTIENTERQLEALGESLEHSNIEILIESKLPLWILNKIYKHKKKDMPWSILKLRNFLTCLINVNEQIRNCQHSLTQLNIKSTTTKPEQKQRYNSGGTSALSTMKDNQNTSKTTTTKRRPCVFCNQDHWDSDCVNYMN
uniref:Gag protein n=1 Tax=Brugia malayi TaxID=6279 RepID=A8NRK8_BRUMA